MKDNRLFIIVILRHNVSRSRPWTSALMDSRDSKLVGYFFGYRSSVYGPTIYTAT